MTTMTDNPLLDITAEWDTIAVFLKGVGPVEITIGEPYSGPGTVVAHVRTNGCGWVAVARDGVTLGMVKIDSLIANLAHAMDDYEEAYEVAYDEWLEAWAAIL